MDGAAGMVVGGMGEDMGAGTVLLDIAVAVIMPVVITAVAFMGQWQSAEVEVVSTEVAVGSMEVEADSVVAVVGSTGEAIVDWP